jgi:transcriptional regulator with XRE-family HTH domain
MSTNKKAIISSLVKEGRLSKGYTQKELSELSNISIRSIQRIENGEIVPRSYTLKTIAEIIGKPFEDFTTALQESNLPVEDTEVDKKNYPINKTQRIILTTALCLVIPLLAIAFIAQSSKFPETSFEYIVFIVLVAVGLGAILFYLWREKE